MEVVNFVIMTGELVVFRLHVEPVTNTCGCVSTSSGTVKLDPRFLDELCRDEMDADWTKPKSASFSTQRESTRQLLGFKFP